MSISGVSESASLENNSIGINFKAYKNAEIKDSIIGNNVSIGDDSVIQKCIFEKISPLIVEIILTTVRLDSLLIPVLIQFSKIGRYCSIARNVDIGGFDHDFGKVTTMPLFRFAQMKQAAISW